jgi:hypothetical protein
MILFINNIFISINVKIIEPVKNKVLLRQYLPFYFSYLGPSQKHTAITQFKKAN